MNIYKICSAGYDGSSYAYLTHTEKYSDEELKNIVDSVLEKMKPAILEEKKKIVQRGHTDELEAFKDDAEMIEYVTGQFNDEHDIDFCEFFYTLPDVLVKDYGFQEFKFTAEHCRNDDDAIVTFKMNE